MQVATLQVSPPILPYAGNLSQSANSHSPGADDLSQSTSQMTQQNKKEISTHPLYPSTVAGNSSPNFHPKIPVPKIPAGNLSQPTMLSFITPKIPVPISPIERQFIHHVDPKSAINSTRGFISHLNGPNFVLLNIT
ncbi:hypothetical protein Adt_46114 [Abeliophyllum distichum]|uniref:Uncharacterized protein n=1 Tax=Abeliophyllum distichum TaxID=126358 RepID=A0ABD1P4B6_9LAMI